MEHRTDKDLNYMAAHTAEATDTLEMAANSLTSLKTLGEYVENMNGEMIGDLKKSIDLLCKWVGASVSESAEEFTKAADESAVVTDEITETFSKTTSALNESVTNMFSEAMIKFGKSSKKAVQSYVNVARMLGRSYGNAISKASELYLHNAEKIEKAIAESKLVYKENIGDITSYIESTKENLKKTQEKLDEMVADAEYEEIDEYARHDSFN
jgi:hypothetical protein